MTQITQGEGGNNLSYVLDRYWYVRSMHGPDADEASLSLVGQNIFSIVSDPSLRELLRVIFQKVFEKRSFVHLSYRCDTPELRRFCVMRVERRRSDEGLQLLVENRTLLAQRRSAVRLLDGRQIRSEEKLVMCSWCKKVQLAEIDWVEAEIAVERLSLLKCVRLPSLNHAVCPQCVDYLTKAAWDLDVARE